MSVLARSLSFAIFAVVAVDRIHACTFALIPDNCNLNGSYFPYEFNYGSAVDDEKTLSKVVQTSPCSDLDIPNEVEAIGPGAFDSSITASKLTIKKRYYTQGKSIQFQRESFQGADRIENFRLQATEATLAPDVFSEMKGLKTLNMDVQNPVKIPERTFAGLSNLEKLIVTLYTDSIDQKMFEGVNPQLKELNLSGGKLSQIAPSTFSKLEGLRSLNLAGHKLANVNADMFQGLKSLEKLDLKLNPISSLSKDALKELPNLRDLRMASDDSHPLSSIENGVFDATPKLRVLQLRDHDLKKIDGDLLKNLQQLELLDIGTDKSFTIDKKVLLNLPKLKTVLIGTDTNLGTDIVQDYPELSHIRFLYPPLYGPFSSCNTVYDLERHMEYN